MTPFVPDADPARPESVDPHPARSLAPADCSRIAALHAECLPNSLVVLLGRRYAEAFYRYASRSDRERVFLAREGDRVVGACVLSLSPGTLPRRLLVHTPLLLFAALGILRPGLAGSLLGSSRYEPSQGEDVPSPGLPEVLLIFTSPTLRSRGLGADLLSCCERFLAGRGQGRYTVRTLDDVANAALRFYARNGFLPHGRSFQHGRWFRVFQKTIAAAPAGEAALPDVSAGAAREARP
jgi:ribosomal protein S18 acetylase RimI-like enzyme